MKTETAMLGGSFDPVHLGHLFLLHCAVTYTDCRRIVLVPAALSNFKQDRAPVASDTQRLEMLRLALEDYRKIYPDDPEAEIVISETELSRGGVSYTIDTVRELISQYGLDKLGLIIGDDHIPSLTKWHDYENLRQIVRFLICRRMPDESVWDCIPKGLDYVRIQPECIYPQSSTLVRSSVASHSDWLSPGVAEYVRKNGLYVN